MTEPKPADKDGMSNVCEHGGLRRKCGTCDDQKEIENLRAENEALRARAEELQQQIDITARSLNALSSDMPRARNEAYEKAAIACEFLPPEWLTETGFHPTTKDDCAKAIRNLKGTL